MTGGAAAGESPAAGEIARRLVHLGAGGLVLLLPSLTVAQAALCASLAIVFNALVLPRLGARLFREGERRRPLDSGILLYPVAVLLLLLVFGSRTEVVAGAWAILAAGDPAAGLVGRAWGRTALPWNPRKTILGTAAFAAAAAAACVGILMFLGAPAARAILLGAPTALFAAFVESLPWRLNDNLTVPLLSGLFLYGLVAGDAAGLGAVLGGRLEAFLLGGSANFLLAVAFRNAGLVDRSGMIAGFAVGTLTWGFGGGPAYAILLAFFVLGSAATRIGRSRKDRLGVAQAHRGARSARHAIANCGVAIYLVVLASTAPRPPVFLLAFVCAYATAAFDTVSSEIGQAYGGRPVLITTLRPVPVGTDGGVTLLGTLAGFAAAAIVAGLAALLHLASVATLPAVLVAAFLGSSADSILGATLERGGFMDNDAVNFSNTLVGALAGIGAALVLGLA